MPEPFDKPKEDNRKLSEQNGFYDLKNALQVIKNALQVIKNGLDNNNEKDVLSTESTDRALADLAEKINLFVGKEGLLTTKMLAQYQDLQGLMLDIIDSLQKKGSESVSLSEEKKLLLELMYGIVADIGRRNSAQQIAQKAQDAALSFYTHGGLGTIYNALLEKAGVNELVA